VSVFAPHVTQHITRATPAGTVFKERAFRESMHYTVLEDPAAFAKLCEGLRVQMLESLAEEPGPINHVRVVAMNAGTHEDGSAAVALRTRCCHEPESA